MANNAIGISAGIDTKPLKDALKDIDANVEKIAQSMDAMVMSLQTGFEKTAKAASKAGEATEKAFSTEAFTKPLDGLKSLNNEFASGKKSVDEYIKELAKMASIDIKPTKATPIQLQQVGKGEMPQVTNIPQLHELLAVNKRIVEQGNLTTDELRQQVNLHDTLKQRAKELLMSDRQREEQQEKINKKKEREAELSARKVVPTYEGALNLSDKSITERVEKTKQLIKVRQNLSSEDANYSQKLRTVNQELFKLDLANKQAVASGVNLQSQSSKLSNTFDSLYRRMAYYLSVGFAINFVQKMAAVRGEFELQQRSLQAIIQNKDEADKVFAKITALAVKSPFQLRELVGYTKQLAAYRIETEKLYDTTKMLADVSAGLGVDMGRLILAYGQVKSAAVLRGQELRQFTEAGIPIIQALADKFTQLNGRVVSTGEVFEMVSNRMVSFKMVDEIFKDMTQSGGIFYNMQEIQAETLKGKISNLNDAFDIMLNKMGTENKGALKGSVNAVTYLLENYELLVDVIGKLILAYGAFKVSQILYIGMVGKENASILQQIQNDKRLELSRIRRKSLTETLTISESKLLLSGSKLNISDYKLAMSTSNMTKEQAKLFLALNARNKAVQEAAIQTGQLTAAEVKAVVATGGLSRLTTTVGISFKSLGIAARTAGIAMKGFLASALPLIALSAIIEGIMAVNEAYTKQAELLDKLNKKNDETTIKLSAIEKAFNKATQAYKEYNKVADKTVDITEKMKGEFGKQLIELKKLADELKGLGISYQFDFGKIDTSNIEYSFKKYIELAKLGQAYTFEFTDALNQANTFWGGTGEFWGNTLDKDLTQMQESYEKIFSGSLMQRIDRAGKLLEANSGAVGGYAKELIGLLNVEKKADESDLEFATKRREIWLKLSKEIPHEVGKVNMATKGALTEFTKSFSGFSQDMREVESELDEVVKSTIKKMNIDINNLSEKERLALTLSINTYFADKEMQEWQKKWAIDFAKTKFNINVTLPDISQTIPKTWKDRISEIDIEKKLFSEDDLQNIVSYNDLIDKLNSAYNESISIQQALKETNPIDEEAKKKLNDDITGNNKLLSVIRQVSKEYGILFKTKGTGKSDEDRLKDQISLIKEVMKAWKQSFDVYGNEMKANEIVTKRFGDQWKHIIPSEFSMDLLMGVNVDTSAIGGLVESLMKGVSDKARQYGKQEQNQIVFDASIDLGEKKLKEFQTELENSLKGYELSISLDGYGAFGGMVAKMFEVKPQDFATTISTLEGLNEEIKKDTSVNANQRLTLSKKVDDEIAKLQKDNYDRTFKGYNDLLSKYAQYEFRRIKIAEESAKERENIEASYQQNMINDIQKEQLLEAVNKKEKTETAKVSFEEFKGSDTWIQAFDELGNVSAATLNAMMQKMEQFRATAGKDLDPTQLREYMNTFKKLREEIIERDPFKALGVNIRAANKAQKELQILMGKEEGGGFKGTAEEYVGKATAENLTIEQELTEKFRQQLELRRQIEELDVDEDEDASLQDLLNKQEALELLKKQNTELEATQSKNRNIIDLSNQMTTGWNNASKAGEKVGSILKTTMSSVKGLADVFGMETDSMSADMLDLGDVLIEQAVSMIAVVGKLQAASSVAITTITTTSVAANGAMVATSTVAATAISTVEKASVILAVISAALQIATAIANLFVGNKDKKLAKKQKESEGRVIALKNAYDLLDRAISRAFGDDKIAKMGQQTDMLVRQQNELKKQIQLEKDKKKTDKDKVKELEQQLMELNQAITDSLMNMRDQILGIGVIDVANDLGDALKEAFMTGEESAMDWGAKTKEIVANMVYQMLVAKYLAPKIAAEMDKFWEKTMPKAAAAEKRAKEVEDLDLKISEAEAKGYDKDYINNLKKQRDAAILARDKAIKLAEDEIPNVTEQAAEGLKNGLEGSITSFENLVPEWTKDWLKEIGGAEDKLSGLQKGIQGITENTAEALESLLNTIRFEIFTHTTLLSQIANNINMNSAVSSQLVLYASQSYNVLLQMRAWQQSITAPGHPQGGDGLKAFID